MMPIRTLFVIFGLFIAGLAVMGALRGTRGEGDATAKLVALSEAAGLRHRAASDSRPVLPNIQFKDRSGAARSLADFGGRVVLLNVWATWCAPCRKEMRD